MSKLTHDEQLELLKMYAKQPYSHWKNTIQESIHPALLKMAKMQRLRKANIELSTIDYDVNSDTVVKRPLSALEIPKDKPVIFVFNHQNIKDIPLASYIVREHARSLVASEEGTSNDIRGINKLFLDMDGVHWVDRRDEDEYQERAKEKGISKEDATTQMILDLLHGKSIKAFIEGTWNHSENVLFLLSKAGIAKIAQITGAYIYPIYLDYNLYRDDNYIAYPGKPFLVDVEEDHIEANNIIRDQMCTLAYNVMQHEQQTRGSQISREEAAYEFLRYINMTLDEFSQLDIEYEKRFIYRPKDTNGNDIVPEEEVFPPLYNAMNPKLSNFVLSKTKSFPQKRSSIKLRNRG